MRLYSEAEARELLPEVIPVVERLSEAFIELRALKAAISSEARGAAGDGNLLADPWAETDGEDRGERLARQVRDAAARLDDWGIELKDPERGLIDFYHQRGTEVVFLCYLLGERDIEYWHTLTGGFAGRQRL
ncbi:MAG: DUF2203 domain-containing protein [Anaerolinea sp.]|nr:DUF2203 domain-containing protein [Anaerolinea sp.]